MIDRRFSSASMPMKAKWWQLQCRGLVSYYAAFIGLTMLMMRALSPVNNGGSRKILGVGCNFNVSSELSRVQSEFGVCVQTFYCKCVVGYVGHCFRHTSHPISKLLSLPFSGRLISRRSQRRRDPVSGFTQCTERTQSQLRRLRFKFIFRFGFRGL